ncbi:hypothetical protein LJC68_09745 [Bacteroidales bacterium OttesenSCG-928-B11]|nr:hypothetical protein [Bacteroidales bacterium OttesenSCG-928-E04]MDL2313143.1 hypothetical protein [Bacteroidales bacterium OttesenSCG-928-B11]MDL2326816.1 hypothetical protein [Bacteroidales bacterium OttesenSCG-928-A14]
MESHFEHKYNREYDSIDNLVDAAIFYEIVQREDKDTIIAYINDLYKDAHFYEPTDIKVDEDDDGMEIRIPLTLRALKGILRQREKEMQYVKSNFNQLKNEPPQTIAQYTPIRQFTDEQIDLLKSYFVAQFKGMGNNTNYFDDNLLKDLKKNRSGIEYAKIAKLIFESSKSQKEFKKKPFSKWYDTFCNIMGIEKCKYKKSQIRLDDTIKGEFYYLT